MAEFIMVACDLHDKTMVLKIARGREAAEKSTVQNTPAGRRWLIDDLRARAGGASRVRVIFAYEASGQGFGLHDELTAAGIECHVLAPTKIPHATQHGGTRPTSEMPRTFCTCCVGMCWLEIPCQTYGFLAPKRGMIESWYGLGWTRRKKGWRSRSRSRAC